MTTLQTEFTEHELLETHPISEPLIAGGVRCHGGFDENGDYVSPRTLNRAPAIRAWQERRAEQFDTPLLDIPLERWPEHYPNVAQAKFLISEGVAEPISTTLTRIGTVEGFGSMIRYSTVPNLQRCFDEDVHGTAMLHLDRGLYEAHARDEAGFEDEGGHQQMWFAARDIAFENPPAEDETNRMLERMGFRQASDGGTPTPPPPPPRVLPDDIDYDLEMLIQRMARLLLIEISAFHTFAWAEEVLCDIDLVPGDGDAARLVSYIRSDETPHVEYLKTVLSEMRDRTFVGESGKRYQGADMIGRIWESAVSESLGVRREQNLQVTLREIGHALDGNARGKDIFEEFHHLGSIRPKSDGSWAPSGEVTGY